MTLAVFGVSMQVETRDKLDAMARADVRSRSNFIAQLVDREHARRQQPRVMTDEGVGYSIGEPVTEEAT